MMMRHSCALSLALPCLALDETHFGTAAAAVVRKEESETARAKL